MHLSRCANAHPPVYLGDERTTLLSVKKWVPALWTGAHLGVPETGTVESSQGRKEKEAVGETRGGGCALSQLGTSVRVSTKQRMVWH